MVKRSLKRTYSFEGSKWISRKSFHPARNVKNVQGIYCLYLQKNGRDNEISVRNRNNRKDLIAIICTDMSLDENDIIRIYGHRWEIEVFFKTCKSNLLLRKEYHGLSYDGLTAHVAFMLLSVGKRDKEDERTLGELFYLMIEEVADITFEELLQILVNAILNTMREEFHVTDEQIESLYERFISKLPVQM